MSCQIMHDMVEGVVGPIVRGKFRHEKSPWGVVMNNMWAKRRGERVIQLFADGASGWLVWEVSQLVAPLGAGGRSAPWV